MKKMTLVLIGCLSGITHAAIPSDVLDLESWKLTVPYAKEGMTKPLEIHQPDLADFANPSCFFVHSSGEGVVFRAHCTETTTKNSNYPRCELREMTGRKSPNHYKYKEKASWGTADGGLHRMEAELAITALPPVKPHVVCAQIHDANDDLMMIRLEGRKLFVERNKIGDVMLDGDYELGTRFALKIEAVDGHVRVSYNGVQKMDWEKTRNRCYFKAGCYTQSNSAKGDLPTSYGEVVIYTLKIEHAVRNMKK
ncbi:polysaccharide lyase family 7 protein [Pontiellaceae bacterium B12227]|nr:polysaccharide lyase family 7 protein [Pontiellaceae bacterium B12227]